VAERHTEYDVPVVGGSGVDTVVRVDALPVPLAGSVPVGPIEEHPGRTGGYVALGVPVSTDPHDWDGLSDHHREFALRSGLVLLSAAGAGEGTPDLMRRIMHEGRAEAVVATAGAEGSYVLLRNGGPVPHHVPAVVPPAPVVDSNGAGDAFACGFPYGRLAGRDVLECARLGAVAGAHACTAPGSAALADEEALLAAERGRGGYSMDRRSPRSLQ
jgi:hypothetical protein